MNLIAPFFSLETPFKGFTRCVRCRKFWKPVRCIRQIISSLQVRLQSLCKRRVRSGIEYALKIFRRCWLVCNQSAASVIHPSESQFVGELRPASGGLTPSGQSFKAAEYSGLPCMACWQIVRDWPSSRTGYDKVKLATVFSFGAQIIVLLLVWMRLLKVTRISSFTHWPPDFMVFELL